MVPFVYRYRNASGVLDTGLKQARKSLSDEGGLKKRHPLRFFNYRFRERLMRFGTYALSV